MLRVECFLFLFPIFAFSPTAQTGSPPFFSGRSEITLIWAEPDRLKPGHHAFGFQPETFKMLNGREMKLALILPVSPWERERHCRCCGWSPTPTQPRSIPGHVQCQIARQITGFHWGEGELRSNQFTNTFQGVCSDFSERSKHAQSKQT
jgi:hypothetical protein